MEIGCRLKLKGHLDEIWAAMKAEKVEQLADAMPKRVLTQCSSNDQR